MVGGALGVAAYGLFCRLEGRQPAREILYELELARHELRDLDATAAARERSDLIVGLTTIPSRLPFVVPTLKSLLLQNVPPGKILLHLPKHSRREQVEYSVPEELKNLEVIQIVRCPDWGPATKILPALLDSHPDQRVVAVDDDRIYRPTLLEDLLEASEQHPEARILISCRTNFYSSETNQTSGTLKGFHSFFLIELDDNDIEKFIKARLGSC
ncbi:MAG: hypothetical protein IH795_03280 [Bacteroidetes bacterium]|nr:hypothetical protein [Bacteroidota bacterium]